MLKYIKIKDYILINHFESHINKAFTTIIGETGSGKSLILSAINLACGKRVDFDIEKNIKNKTEITLVFDIEKNKVVKEVLDSFDISYKNECIIKRTIDKSGKSVSTVNGQNVKLKDISYISSFLIEIFSQNSTNKIFDEENQINILDNFAGVIEQRHELSFLNKEYQKIKREIEKDETIRKERREKLIYLEHQIKDFEEIDLGENEWSELEKEFAFMEKAKEHKESILKALSLVTEEEYGLKDILANINKNISYIDVDKKEVEDVKSTCLDLYSIANDLTNDLEKVSDLFDFDEERYAYVSEKVALINKFAKRNGILPESVYKYGVKIQQEYEELNNYSFDLELSEQKLSEIKEAWFEVAKQVSEKRRAVAEKFVAEIESNLSELKMAESRIRVDFKDISYQVNQYGNEYPKIKISTNLGQDFHDMNIVMSGGEASRLSLVIQSLLNSKNRTIIFDEIDAGIGGLTANLVGDYMRRISVRDQVIAITHLPQVVMYSDDQFVVRKNPRYGENITNIMIDRVSENELVYEIAKMMGHEIVNRELKEQIKNMIKEKHFGKC